MESKNLVSFLQTWQIKRGQIDPAVWLISGEKTKNKKNVDKTRIMAENAWSFDIFSVCHNRLCTMQSTRFRCRVMLQKKIGRGLILPEAYNSKYPLVTHVEYFQNNTFCSWLSPLIILDTISENVGCVYIHQQNVKTSMMTRKSGKKGIMAENA